MIDHINMQNGQQMCARIINQLSGPSLSGESEAKLMQWLTKDLNTGVDHACK